MEELLLQYEPLVRTIAKKFYGAEEEDLIQSGFLGLTKAYKNYDKSKSVKFSTYAYQYIYGEMYETVARNRHVYINKDYMRLYKSLIRAREQLSQKYHREISVKETCKYLHLDETTIANLLSILSSQISLEQINIDIAKKDNYDEVLMLKDGLSHLSSDEREIIKKRYFEDMSQEETAKVLGLNQVKVSRLEKISKNKMKHFIGS